MLSLGGVADGNAGSGDNGKGGSEDDGNIAGGPGSASGHTSCSTLGY